MNRATESVFMILVMGELLARMMRGDPHKPVMISLTAGEPMTDMDKATYDGMMGDGNER